MIIWRIIDFLWFFSCISSYTVKYNLFIFNELDELHCSFPCDENATRTTVNNFTTSTLTINEDGYLFIHNKPLGIYPTGLYGTLSLDNHIIHVGDDRSDFWMRTYNDSNYYPPLQIVPNPIKSWLEENGLNVSLARKYQMLNNFGTGVLKFYVPFIITVDYNENNVNNGYELNQLYQGHSSIVFRAIIGDGGILKQSSNSSSVDYSIIEIDIVYSVTSAFSLIYIPNTENSYIDGFIEDDEGNHHSFLIMTPYEGYDNCIFNNTPGVANNITCYPCKSGYKKVYKETKCLSSSTKGYYLSSADDLYHKCDLSCGTCDTTSTHCLSCSDGYYRVYNTSAICLNETTKGNYYLLSGIDRYYPCDQSCSTCEINSTNCLSCSTGYYPMETDSRCLTL